MKQVPNLFTLFNLFFGCLAIVAILQNGISIQYNAEGEQLLEIPEKIWMASLFIGCAAVVDFLDGFVARLFNASSELGKQLDSLADVVSFGVAPALILYQFLRMSFAKEPDGLNAHFILLTPAFLLAMAAAYRLGKFNIDNQQTTHFRGVPTPATGLLVASLPLIYWHSNNEILLSLLFNKWFLYAITVLLSWLMISNIPMLALKLNGLNKVKKIIFIGLGIIALLSAFLLHWLAVPIVFICYLILSFIFRRSL